MGINGLDHVAVVVKDLEAAVKVFTEVLGFDLAGRESVDHMGVDVAILESGGFHLELVHPTTAEGGVAKFLEKRGEGLHHIALNVKGIEETLRSFEEGGVSLIDNSPRDGAAGKRVAFLHPRSCFGTLIELCEKCDS
jgi:methylmalonyl-CoA/ethylmalonyl-CoA epimerase